ATIHGYATAVRSDNKLRVINTEKHFDHISGNSYFQDRGIKVWAHRGVHRTEQEFEAEIAEFNSTIPNPTRRMADEARVFFHGTRIVQPNHPVDQDMNFDLGGIEGQILLTPGHTPTNLCVWVPEDRVLYTGDCLINQYIPNLDAGMPQDWKI